MLSQALSLVRYLIEAILFWVWQIASAAAGYLRQVKALACRDCVQSPPAQ